MRAWPRLLALASSTGANTARSPARAPQASRPPAAASAAPAPMGQKSIEAFFRRPAVAAKAASTQAGEGQGMPDSDAAPSAAAGGGPREAQPHLQEQQAAAALPPTAATAAVDGASGSGQAQQPAAAEPAGQLSESQLLRAHANRNAALAKQVVRRAEAVAGLPQLGDLLVEESWRALLGAELGKPYFAELEAFLRSEWGGSQMVFPPKDAVFRALNSVPVDKVRVVILGQDPYHDLGQAMGLSFSVPQGKQVPSSLRNMYKELQEDLGCPVPSHGNLEKWAHQGVLLLNAVLTVRAHSAASHAKRGWEKFTDAAIAGLSRERSGVVFLLWGKYAQEKGKVIDKKRNHVLASPHPSGLSAHRGFFGCRHFSQANELLRAAGQQPIDWCIE